MKKNNNMFMIALVAVTLIAVGVLIWLGYSKNTAITEELMGEREKVTNKLRNLSRRPYVNQGTILATEKRVEMLRDNLSQVCKLNYEFNSHAFSVPMLDVIGSKPRPALPYDAKIWESKELAATYVTDYRKTMSEVLAKLNPTAPPTEADINLEIKRQLEILENEARITGKEANAAKGGLAAGGPGVPGGMYPGAGRMPGSSAASKDIATQAQEYGLNNQVLRKSQSGYIYADEASMFPMFIRGRIYSFADLPPEDVWLAQKSVWVQTDIVNAISETIKEVFDARKLPDEERNVLNSPIKHLVSINIEKSKAATSSTGQGMMGGPMGPGGYGGGYGGSSYGGSSNEVEKAESLTQYNANPLFDVANYTVTLIMPTRYLPLLEQKLLKQNYHVILSEEIAPVDASALSSPTGRGGMGGGQFGMIPMGGRSSGGKTTVGDLYNYGTEPVSRVTISAQLLLMTSFSRGQWDATAQKWITYPLMPAEVMKTLPKAALRQEDKDFLEQLERLEKGERLFEGRPTIPWYRNDAWRPENPAADDVKPQ